MLRFGIGGELAFSKPSKTAALYGGKLRGSGGLEGMDEVGGTG
jgi:hypothetical protein